jgi:hypothetical protein
VRAFRIDWPFRGHYSIDVDGVYRPTSRTEFDHHIETWRNKIDAEKRERMLLALKSTKHYIRKSIFSPTELQFTLNFVQLLGGVFNIFEVLRSSIFIISQLLKSRIIGFQYEVEIYRLTRIQLVSINEIVKAATNRGVFIYT